MVGDRLDFAPDSNVDTRCTLLAVVFLAVVRKQCLLPSDLKGLLLFLLYVLPILEIPGGR